MVHSIVEPKVSFVDSKLRYSPRPRSKETKPILLAGTLSQYRKQADLQPVRLLDIRGREQEFDLRKQGFQVEKRKSAEVTFEDEQRIKSIVYAEVADLVRNVTGASKVHPFSHLVRRNTRASIQDMVNDPKRAGTEVVPVTVPSSGVHIDQSDRGARIILDNCMQDNDELAALVQSKCRWGIINAWRPIKTVQRDPLCFCDARTVDDDDLFPEEIRLPPRGSRTFDQVAPGGVFELLNVCANRKHQWHYLSSMQPDEVVLLKIFDSKTAAGEPRGVPHTAVELPGTEDAEPRESIEVRCLVFYEDEPQNQ